MEQIALDPLPRRSNWHIFPALALGTVLTLLVYGYRFGQGNHAVYLLDALHKSDPTRLSNDWFTTRTLQYHVVFTFLTRGLMALGILAPAFLALYVALIIAFHIAVFGIVRALGGGTVAYVACVALYFTSAAGTGLGMYQFFQDSSFLPSNIANVALLWGIWMLSRRRLVFAGACFGAAGIFHLNHALIGAGIWVLCAAPLAATNKRRSAIGSLLAIVPSAINIAIASHAKLTESGAMPFADFIELYVRLRHPHHYDPSSWPAGIWIAFGWTIIPAIALLRGTLRCVALALLALISVALLGAGIWYVSETLVQMSLYRFSIYVQLLGCIATGAWLARVARRPNLVPIVSTSVCLALCIVAAIRGPFFGEFRMPADDEDYVRLCAWVAANTPRDATFLVPPDEESMRYVGRRAIVVNFKGVPQLSRELIEWRRRLFDIADVTSASQLPRGYVTTLSELRRRYDSSTARRLRNVADQFGARYIVATRALEGLDAARVETPAEPRYVLYDLRRAGARDETY